jgi:MFS transporter, DHA1 family, multidrug/chloramphenicol efflux transport protein
MFHFNKKIGYYFASFVVLFEFTVYLTNDMIMPGMPQVTKEFHADISYIPLSFTAYLLGGASLQLILGPLSDSLGRRKPMLLGALIFLICSLFLAQSSTIGEFIILRFFQGMGLCFIGVIGYSSIQEMFPEKEAVVLISIMSNISLVAPLLGPLLGGIYVEYFHWRGIFIITSILALISAVGLFLYMPETAHLRYSKNSKPEKKPDLSVLPKLSIHNICHVFTQILKNKVFLSGCIMAGLNAIPILTWIAISPIILMEKFKFSSAMFGVSQIPVFGGILIATLFVSKLVKIFKLTKIVHIGSILMLCAITFMGVSTLIFRDNALVLIIPMCIYGIGLGSYSASMFRLVLFSSSESKGSVASLFSIITALIFIMGTKSMEWIYHNQQNWAFALFSTASLFLAIPFRSYFLKHKKEEEIQQRKLEQLEA